MLKLALVTIGHSVKTAIALSGQRQLCTNTSYRAQATRQVSIPCEMPKQLRLVGRLRPEMGLPDATAATALGDLHTLAPRPSDSAESKVIMRNTADTESAAAAFRSGTPGSTALSAEIDLSLTRRPTTCGEEARQRHRHSHGGTDEQSAAVLQRCPQRVQDAPRHRTYDWEVLVWFGGQKVQWN